MAKVFLRKKISERIHNGNNWVFQNEIGDIVGDIQSGDEVAVFSSTGSFVGKGWYAADTAIAVRILTRDLNTLINTQFIFDKIQKAIFYRNTLHLQNDAYRIFNAEADGISGLYIDKWKRYYVITCLSKALDQRYEWIVAAMELLGIPQQLILKDDSNKLRKFEKLSLQACSNFPDNLSFSEWQNNYTIENAHQFSLDRSLLRLWISKLTKDKNVWDLCCGNGALGKTAMLSGASAVLYVDNDQKWKGHFEIYNNDKNTKFLLENVFDFLKQKNVALPDCIILDPPIFNETTNKPLSAYYELTLAAMKHLSNGGILILGNSSSKISDQDFESMLQSIIVDKEISFRFIQKFGLGADFGVDPMYPHLDYLRFWIIQKVGK